MLWTNLLHSQSDQIRWNLSHRRENHWRCGTPDSGWNKWSHFKLEEKQLQCLRCKQMYLCIPFTLKVGILLKVKQSSDNLDNRSYYWLHWVKSQLLYMHLKFGTQSIHSILFSLISRKEIVKVKDNFLSTSICDTSLFEPWLQWVLLSIIATWVDVKWLAYHIPAKYVNL